MNGFHNVKITQENKHPQSTKITLDGEVMKGVRHINVNYGHNEITTLLLDIMPETFFIEMKDVRVMRYCLEKIPLELIEKELKKRGIEI